VRQPYYSLAYSAYRLQQRYTSGQAGRWLTVHGPPETDSSAVTHPYFPIVQSQHTRLFSGTRWNRRRPTGRHGLRRA